MATKTKKVVKVVVKKRLQAPVTEVFSANPAEPTVVAVPRTKVELVINGQSRGAVETEGAKLGAFVAAAAQRAGIRTFSVYADGQKLDTAAAGRSLGQIARIEIVAKDARGHDAAR